MSNQVVDIHLHPAFKSFLSKHYEGVLPDLKENEGYGPVEMKNPIVDFADEHFFHLLDSQCSFEQMDEGDMQIGIVGFSNVERGFAESGGFGRLLKSKPLKILDTRYFKEVDRGEVSYLRLLIKEIEYYHSIVEKNNSNIGYLNRNKKVEGLKYRLIFGLEGGHNLSKKLVGNFDQYDTFDENNKFDLSKANVFKGCVETDFTKDPVKNLSVIYQKMYDAGMDILYLTLTHLTHIDEQLLANHAFGLKMLKHPSFYPHTYGISPLGMKVVDAALNNKINIIDAEGNEQKENRPILIDVKHMSLQGRLDYYKFLKGNNEKYKAPVIASHVGVTGYSLDAWKDALLQKKLRIEKAKKGRCVRVVTDRKVCGYWGGSGRTKFTFNPWTINLLDEDIMAIIESKGLIGLSLDVRILGFEAAFNIGSRNKPEYLSQLEFKKHFPNISLSKMDKAGFLESDTELEDWEDPDKTDKHPLCFCFNIVHIMIVGQARMSLAADVVQKVICIGSDFDGLINPLKVCRDATRYKDLKSQLLQWLPVAAEAYQKEHGFDEEKYAFAKNGKLDAFVNGILSDNAIEFLNGHGWQI